MCDIGSGDTKQVYTAISLVLSLSESKRVCREKFLNCIQFIFLKSFPWIYGSLPENNEIESNKKGFTCMVVVSYIIMLHCLHKNKSYMICNLNMFVIVSILWTTVVVHNMD